MTGDVAAVKTDLFNFFSFLFSFYVRYSQHCFICRPSDSTVSEDAGIEPRTVFEPFKQYENF